MLGNKKESAYFKKIYNKMMRGDIENHINFLSETVSQILANNETVKVHEMIAAVKKIIKSPIEAKNKFFALLILVEVMKPGRPFVLDYFDKKIARRLVIITKHRVRERGRTNLPEIGSTCLQE